MQERNAEKRKDRIRVYSSVLVRFYKRRREGDAAQRIVNPFGHNFFFKFTTDHISAK